MTKACMDVTICSIWKREIFEYLAGEVTQYKHGYKPNLCKLACVSYTYIIFIHILLLTMELQAYRYKDFNGDALVENCRSSTKICS